MSVKRKLTQNDLRKAMSEHKKKYNAVKKIESPLAKYTDSGQLMCVLCKSIVNSETIWPVHLNSKVHKENIALAKKTKLETEEIVKTSNVSTFKRPLSPSQNTFASKKIKGILKNSSQLVVQTKLSLPTDFFDNDSKQVNDGSASIQKSEKEDSVSSTTNESMEVEEVEKEKEKEKIKDMNLATLPEGFFDDPVMDAKVRNVEYKDPIDEEWEKFQKEIKEETAQSAQIIADDQEEAVTERQFEEVEEQIKCWSRVIDIVKCKEQMQATNKLHKNQDNDDDTSSNDEAEFDEFLDWRAKSSYK